MNSWRVTKYNPQNRDINGFYTKEEWTSVSDVGERFGQSIFTLEEYLLKEEKYIEAIKIFLESLEVNQLQISELEKYEENLNDKESEIYTNGMVNLFYKIKNGDMISIDDILILSKLVLRDKLWCKINGDLCFIHFGYDYYMYFGNKNNPENALKKIRELGLFVECIESPYI